jgi:hypothetical protein
MLNAKIIDKIMISWLEFYKYVFNIITRVSMIIFKKEAVSANYISLIFIEALIQLQNHLKTVVCDVCTLNTLE